MKNSIILTSDRASFTDFSRSTALGYVACMPRRLVPRQLMNWLFTPELPHDGNEAIFAPYALRKVEAALIYARFKDVMVVPPSLLEHVVNSNTKVLGISVHDPFGLSPVSTKLTILFGGGPSWTSQFFDELSLKIRNLKKKHGFKVLAGGPGAWQFDFQRPDWIDVVFKGEVEVDLPEVVRSMLENHSLPTQVFGRNPRVDQIPSIVKPSRMGEVQITRGCRRGCQFCSITPETFRTIPWEQIRKEIEINLASGERNVDLITDDLMLYGSKRLTPNHDAIVSLFRNVKALGAEQIYFSHISAPPIRQSPETIEEIANIAEYDRYGAENPVIGLENGSERIISKYMRGKVFPYLPEDWGDVITDSAATLTDNHIHPCYTMTIGYDDETEDDVRKSIQVVERIINSGLKVWIFPLPVIPISTSRLRNKNHFPERDLLPGNFWELLYICWKHDLAVTRQLMPGLNARLNSHVLSRIVNSMTDGIFSSIEGIFYEMMSTRGKSTESFSNIDISGITGIVRSVIWLSMGLIGRRRHSVHSPTGSHAV